MRIDIPSVLVDLRAQVVDAHRSGVPKPEALAMRAAAAAFGSGGRSRPPSRRPASRAVLSTPSPP